MFNLDSKGIVIIQPEFLTIKAFKNLWESDKPDKVYKLFAYIYFKHDFKSPYKNSFEDNEIEEKLLVDIIQNIKWTPSSLVKEAELKYQELQHTKSLKILHSAENALFQINQYFNDFDIVEITGDNKHAAISSLMKNLKDLPEVISKIGDARKRVENELTTRKLSGKRKLRKRELPPNQR